jgi:hypothetical protein
MLAPGHITDKPRLSLPSSVLLQSIFHGEGCIYGFLASHYWFATFRDPKPYDPGECIAAILKVNGFPGPVKDIMLTLRRIRNALHHRKHAQGSSVYLKDLTRLKTSITEYVSQVDANDGVALLLHTVVTTVQLALLHNFHPESNQCPECGQKLVVGQAKPASSPAPSPAPYTPPQVCTFQEYKEQYGKDALKGRRIVAKLRGKKWNDWYEGYFRSWSGSMVNVDLESVGRITIPINAIFYLEPT